MSTNIDELASIYKQIVSLEVIERLKSCGMRWSQRNPRQYTTSWQDEEGWWDAYITKVGEQQVVLDFRKNARHFLSVSSEYDASVQDLYEEIEFDREQFKIFQSLQEIPGCRVNIYDETMLGGIFGSGSAPNTVN